MIVKPKIRGFICTTAHPDGCAQHVQTQIDHVRQQGAIAGGPKKVLILGASTGYGLASRIVAAFGCQAATVGVFFEKEAEGKRTATAGYYNSVALEEKILAEGLYTFSVNGDAFSDEVKQQVVDIIKRLIPPSSLPWNSIPERRRKNCPKSCSRPWKNLPKSSRNTPTEKPNRTWRTTRKLPPQAATRTNRLPRSPETMAAAKSCRWTRSAKRPDLGSDP